MKALASVSELRSEGFRSLMRELNALSARLGLRQYTTWSKVWEYPWIERRVGHLVAPGTDVLDIGSELSPLPWYWALRGARVWMVETNPEHVALWESCRARLRAEGRLPRSQDTIRWLIVRDERLPLPDRAFDLVSSLSVIEHLPDKRRAVQEALRVLRPGGYLALSFDICEPALGMTFPEWNGRALSMAEFDELVWRHPGLVPLEPQATWNLQDVPAFLAWHRRSASHHNYVTGAAVLRKPPALQTPQRLGSILVTRLDGLGDIVLGTSLLAALRRRWPDARIRMVVRPQHAGVSALLPEWLELATLPFDPRQAVNGREAELARMLAEFAPRCRADLCVLAEHNRVWAGEILAALSRAATVVAFDGPAGLNVMHRPILEHLGLEVDARAWLRVPVAAGCRELEKYRRLAAELDAGALPPVGLRVAAEGRRRAAEVWRRLGLPPGRSVVFFPSSGDQLTKSLPADKWAAWLRHVCRQGYCALLLGGQTDAAVVEQVAALGLPDAARRWIVPAADAGLLAGLLASAAAYIGADTGPMHVAAALGRPTLGVFGGGHAAERFLPVGPRTLVLRMPLPCYGCEWHCPFPTRLCLSEIPPAALLEAGEQLLRGVENPDPARPRVVDVPAPPEIDRQLVGPLMRLHRRWLELNHGVSEHHDYLRRRLDGLGEELGRLGRELASTASAMTAVNARQDEAIAQLSKVLAEMTRQNARRDQAIADIGRTLAEMTRQNEQRDRAIAETNRTLAEISAHNERRDQAIAAIGRTLAEMTRQNQGRDRAIASLGQRTEAQAAGAEDLAQRLAGLGRQHDELRRGHEDLRRRSVRVPSRIYQVLRRLMGRRAGRP